VTRIGSLLFFLLAGSFFWPAFATVKVVATVDRNQLQQGEALIYSINVTSDSGSPTFDSEPRLPDLKGLELVGSSSSTESKSTFINGKFQVEQSRSFDYQLSAAQKGTFTIGASTVSISGKPYTTQPITIKVTPYGNGGGGQIPPQARRQKTQDPNDDVDEMENMFNQLLQRRFRGAPGAPGAGGTAPQPPTNPNDAFFIRVVTDKTKVYAGEQITASWYLYTRGQIADIDTLKYPELKGFWKEEIEMATRLNFSQDVVNGIPYQKALLVSYALFPIKEGKAKVDPYKAKCTVVVGSPFGFGHAYPFTKASPEIPIEVLPVPAEGRPSEYSGAVGKFAVSASLDQATIPANQPVTLKVKFTGHGNAKIIDLPPLSLPPSIEIYSQKADAKFFKDGTSYKEFEVLLIPREAGAIEIPPIKAAYFDPETAKFVSISSPKLQLNVTPGKPGEQPALPAQAGSPDVKPTEPGMPAPMLLEASHVSLPSGVRKASWSIVYALILMTLFVRSYFVLVRKPKKETLLAALRKRMKKVQGFIDAKDWRRAGVEMTNSIYLILGDITDQGGANIQYEKLMDAASPSLRRELSTPLRDLLSRAEELGFAPEHSIGGAKTQESLNKLRKEIETLLTKAISLGDRNEEK
jgi:hypothetical protein